MVETEFYGNLFSGRQSRAGCFMLSPLVHSASICWEGDSPSYSFKCQDLTSCASTFKKFFLCIKTTQGGRQPLWWRKQRWSPGGRCCEGRVCFNTHIDFVFFHHDFSLTISTFFVLRAFGFGLIPWFLCGLSIFFFVLQNNYFLCNFTSLMCST